MYKNYIKRVLDIVLSFIAIVILSPLFFFMSIAVGFDMGFPILFSQKRVGKDETLFMMYKFRTMNNKRDENGNLLPDEERVTKLGKFLRGTSLDELPELFNILVGKRDIIGTTKKILDFTGFLVA